MAIQNKTVRINIERDIKLHLAKLEHHERIALICKALSSPVRLKILVMLKNIALSIQEIANTLDIPVSSTALYIKNLEDAGLVVTETRSGIHGTMRICTCSMHSFNLQTLDYAIDSIDNSVTMDMPIGNYYQCEIHPTCGLADEHGIIDAYDSVRSFYSPLRTSAQLIWFHKGYIEYRYPNITNPLLSLHEIAFSMELCSEAPGYLEDWPSDITVSINNTEIATYRSPGDFGARRGKFTPPEWTNGRTQYGILKSFSVRENGGYLDGEHINKEICLSQLNLQESSYISLKIEIKNNAKKIGGINIFGAKYGDYPQGISMNLIY